MLHASYGCAFCLQLEASSLHWEFRHLVVCKFTQGHSRALLSYRAFGAFLARLHLRSFMLFCAFQYPAALGVTMFGSCISQLSFFAYSCFRELSACNRGFFCLQWESGTEHLNRLEVKDIRPQKVPCGEGSLKSMRTLPEFGLQTLQTLTGPRLFCSKPLTMVDIMGFLFCIGHPKCWVV